MLDLNYSKRDIEPWLEAKDYTGLFDDVLNKSTSAEKLTGLKDQIRLAVIFEALLSKESYFELNDHTNVLAPRIVSDAHYIELLESYGLLASTNTAKAQTLFFRSVLFVLLAAEPFFGQSEQTPYVLIAYAAGLMAKAYDLNPDVFVSQENSSDDNFTDWIKKMNHGGSGDSLINLAKQLLHSMINHPNYKEDFIAILEKMMPLEWNAFIPGTDFSSNGERLHALPPVRIDLKLKDSKIEEDDKAKIKRILASVLIWTRAANAMADMNEPK